MRIAPFLFSALVAAGTAMASPKHPGNNAPNELDGLFSALGKAQSEDEAKPIEEKILTAFLRSGSPTVDLLMARAAAALRAGNTATGRKLIAAVTNVAPDFAEGWHQRAEMLDAADDDQGAMFCLQKTVTLNPRHFEALAELAGKVEEYGDKPAALRLYRKALALDPQMAGIARTVRALEHDVEGESL
jgi:tetratricopeptide (TPR) repeat protein